MNSLPKTVTGQRRGCDLNPGPSAPESSTLTTRLPEPPENSHTKIKINTERDTKIETVTQHALTQKTTEIMNIKYRKTLE